MGIVAMIGLIFGPFVSLLFAAWFYVRWQNEEDEELALHNKKICFRALIAACHFAGGIRHFEADLPRCLTPFHYKVVKSLKYA